MICPTPRRRSKRGRANTGYRIALLLLSLVFLPVTRLAANDAPLIVLVQPLPTEENAVKNYQPLARYLEALLSRPCTIEAPSNFPAYWSVLRRNNYDLALDGPHFTDYRAHKFGFVPLAKISDNESYTLIRRESERVTDPTQFVGRRIATFGPLSSGSVRLNAMFPNPVRQPVLVEVASTDEGLTLLLEKRVEAAFLPTSTFNERARRGGIASVLTTEPVTRLILSASPRVAVHAREKIRDALLRAGDTDSGRSMLREIGIDRFEPVTEEHFASQRNALKSYWGY